ncbi:MAG: hypothetical protein GY845_16740 [Planctomycetes bacterium]|nr:hypothetical protein [Planctomycetota bacterium]
MAVLGKSIRGVVIHHLRGSSVIKLETGPTTTILRKLSIGTRVQIGYDWTQMCINPSAVWTDGELAAERRQKRYTKTAKCPETWAFEPSQFMENLPSTFTYNDD